MEKPEDDPKLFIQYTSGVSSLTGDGFVTLTWGAEAGQLSATECRALAFNLLNTAEAADTDAFLLRFLQDKVHVPIHQAARILIDFREARARGVQ